MYLRLFFLLLFFCFSTDLFSQKKLNRPSKIVGLEHIDSIVTHSFDLYDLLFEYEKCMEGDGVFCEEDIHALENILAESHSIIQKAIEAKATFQSESLLTRTRATIQLEKAKRAVYHSRKISEEILLAQNVQIE